VEYLELLSEYQKTDIFVFASSSETFGITVLEAMGARLPIACSDRTGLPEILKDAGVYFNPEEPSSIAEAIRQLIESVELRKMLGERAYQYALNYRWDRCSSETINFIKEVEKD
jgi:glycosyltransferase involved in cell wall biosynthesis